MRKKSHFPHLYLHSHLYHLASIHWNLEFGNFIYHMSIPYLIKRKRHFPLRTRIRRVLTLRFLLQASKREKLIFTSLLLTTTTLVGGFVTSSEWYALFALTGFTCAALVVFSFKEDIAGLRYVLIPLFPVLFTLASQVILRIIPMHVGFTFFFAFLYGILMYLILLISNIFNISAVRTIPLIRAAHAASFFLNLVTTFFLLFFLATLKTNPFFLFAGAFLLTLPLTVYLFWSFELAATLTRHVKMQALIVSFIVAQIAFVLGFWPISPLQYALFLTTVVYLCVGLLHQETVNLLRKRIFLEYAIVLSFALLILYITAKWG